MMTFKHSNTLSTMAKLSVLFCFFMLVSCAPKKPVYDLGPRRAPQDNESIIRGMTTKPQAPQPLIPGYDIPAPRYNDPLMIDAPGSEMVPPTPRQPTFPPQSYAPPVMSPMAMAGAPASNESRRRPVNQYSSRLPGLQMASIAPVPYAARYAQRPAYKNPPKQEGFFDKVKNLFSKKEKPEPKRMPGGQAHLTPISATPAPMGNVGRTGFSAESNEPRLEEELIGFPQTPAERAADLSLPTKQEKIPAGRPVSAAPSEKPAFLLREETPMLERTMKMDIAPKTDKIDAKPAPAKGFNPFSFFKSKLAEPKQMQAGPARPPVPVNRPLWEDDRLDNQNLEGLSDDTPVSENKQPAASNSQKTEEKAEVLMEFDISEEGELVNLSDIAPAAGEEEAASSSILQEVVEPAKPSPKQK